MLDLITIDDAFLEGLMEGDCREAANWISRRGDWQAGKFYYSHLTDLLRFCMLIQHGGVYSDFDALLLRPLPLNEWFGMEMPEGRTIIGRDKVDEQCDWCLPGGIYLAPGLMAAEKGSTLLKVALKIGFDTGTYDPTVFNHAGPRAVTVASKTVPRRAVIQLPTEYFYPVNYKEAAQLFRSNPVLPRWGTTVIEILERIKRQSYSLHFFGAQTKKVAMEDGSIVDMLSQWQPPEYFVTDGKEILLEGIRMGTQDTVNLRVNFGSVTPTTCGGSNIANLNHCLSRVKYKPDSEHGFAELTIETDNGETLIPIYNLHALLTITIKTMDRMHKVIELVSSLRQFYPNIPVVVANDGLDAFNIPPGNKRGFEYFPLSYDTGLSASRNIMIKKVETPLVMILDDDFVFTADSDLGYLVNQLMLQKLDVIAATSPSDRNQHGLDYVGILNLEDDELHLIQGDRGVIPNSTCKRVDLVPNIFIARGSKLKMVPWDPTLKLGEHEDWFVRAKEVGLQVATCRSVELDHRQDPHWLNKTPYDRMRGRVWGFLQEALLKHSIKKLKVFGMTTMAIQGIIIPYVSVMRV